MNRWRAIAAATVAAAAAVTACGGSSSGTGTGSGRGPTTILIGLNVPSSADPYVAGVISRGAQLAVDEENAAGGVRIGGNTDKLRLKTYDDSGQPQQAASNVVAAIHDGAVAVIEDGIGMSTSAAASEAAGVPEIAITDGDAALLADKNGNILPSLFGLRIPNSAAADVLATYIVESEHCTNVAILHDDSDNGRDGDGSIGNSLMNTGVTAAPDLEVPASSPAMDAQVLQIKNAKPCGIVLWGGDLFIARAIQTIRSDGVTTPIYTSQQGESPAVRAVAGIADSNGVKIVSGRMTSEGSATDFPNFEHALATYHLGPTDAGFKDAEGQEIRQPNDIDFFAYDAVHVVVAALQKQRSPTPGPTLLTDMTLVTVTSANGDARGFDSQAHEAFAFEDAYIAVIHDMQFEPVKDEALSASLPPENEILANFH